MTNNIFGTQCKKYELVKMNNNFNSLPVTLQDINKDLFEVSQKI